MSVYSLRFTIGKAEIAPDLIDDLVHQIVVIEDGAHFVEAVGPWSSPVRGILFVDGEAL